MPRMTEEYRDAHGDDGFEEVYARNEYYRGKNAYYAGKDRDEEKSGDWLLGWDYGEFEDRGQ